MDNKQYLKDNLKLIEIEIFSYCNRVCWFCPNSFVDRRSENVLMEEERYLNILEQLREINFSGEVTYSRYNEPLSNREIFMKRVRQAREYLPNAVLRTNTNGDYLTRDYIEELADAGFNQLWIQQYLGNDERYDHQEMKRRMDKKVELLGLEHTVLTDIEGAKIEYDLSYRNMTIHIRARNFEIDGSSRGDSVPLAEAYQRTQRCIQPYNNMYIDYNGQAMACCALRSDVPGQESGIVGNAKEDKLWDIFNNEKYSPWRAHHATDGPKEGFCKSCRDSVKIDYEEVLSR